MTIVGTPDVASARDRASITSAGRYLCFLTMVFASGDVWPVINLGFTFRFCQLSALLALLLLCSGGADLRIKRFPGALWLYGFVVWIFVTLPLSLFIERSMAFAVWTLLDVLIVTTFVQYFGTPRGLATLVRWFILSFVILAVFGIAQFVLGVFGISVLTQQWLLDGRFARINGISYEPSYYATYLIVGWVLSVYLLEKGAVSYSRTLFRVCAYTTTIALILSTSRLGWLMMLLWFAVRAGLLVFRTLYAGVVARNFAKPLGISIAITVLMLVPLGSWIANHFDDVSFLTSGLGLMGQASHSADERSADVRQTWQAFFAHPIIGAGIGAVGVEVAAQTGHIVLSLQDAKENDGFGLISEVLASTGVIGGALLFSFWVAVARAVRALSPNLDHFHRHLLRALVWSMAWIGIAMQFNSNFLRVYLFVDIAVLVCALTALSGWRPTGTGSVAGLGEHASDGSHPRIATYADVQSSLERRA